MKNFRITVSIFISILTFLAFCFIALVFYTGLQSPYDVIVGIVVLTLGLFASRFTFNLMRRRGVITAMSGDNSSYELDGLEPVPGDGVIKLTPDQLPNKFLSNELNLGECTIAIWGDWEGRKLNSRHKLKSIDYSLKNRILSLVFHDNCLLKIKNAQSILASNSYLKIMNAKEVLWQVPAQTQLNESFSYLNTGKEIVTKSNTSWKPHVRDIGIGMNAVYLQG